MISLIIQWENGEILNHPNASNGEQAAFTHCVMQGVLMMWFKNLSWIDLESFVGEWGSS